MHLSKNISQNAIYVTSSGTSQKYIFPVTFFFGVGGRWGVFFGFLPHFAWFPIYTRKIKKIILVYLYTGAITPSRMHIQSTVLIITLLQAGPSYFASSSPLLLPPLLYIYNQWILPAYFMGSMYDILFSQVRSPPLLFELPPLSSGINCIRIDSRKFRHGRTAQALAIAI